ncbi:MAG: tetratricopeptide repeat protein [Planctomycetes bacterium]|nr:tetratricopeptide repeat protein [Planctomycetota bacterium]
MAERARNDAQREAEIANAINEFLEGLLAAADPYGPEQMAEIARDVKVVDVLDRAAGSLDTDYPDKPKLEAAIRATLGRAYLGLGLLRKARPQLETALEIRRRIFGDEHPTGRSLKRSACGASVLPNKDGTQMPNRCFSMAIAPAARRLSPRAPTARGGSQRWRGRSPNRPVRRAGHCGRLWRRPKSAAASEPEFLDHPIPSPSKRTVNRSLTSGSIFRSISTTTATWTTQARVGRRRSLLTKL